ncbi:MAG TPA: hypothetical protein ENK77_03310 [Epsilonproteobacteria bacterium]|nr:hypothetical protein [Campylobacterota bacterium]
MTKNEIIETIKSHYSRDLRKQLIKTVLQHEQNKDMQDVEQQYNLLDQIFSYILKNTGWDMPENLKDWNSAPLQIMTEVFPQIESTLWYQDKKLLVSGSIDVKIDDDAKG